MSYRPYESLNPQKIPDGHDPDPSSPFSGLTGWLIAIAIALFLLSKILG